LARPEKEENQVVPFVEYSKPDTADIAPVLPANPLKVIISV